VTKLIKQVILLVPPVLFLSIPALAQEDDTVAVATFVGSYTLWAAIIIGIIASLATLFYANQLKGGVVGTSLTLFGVGMLLVVLGFLTVVISWTDADTQKVVHDLAFILGYILMLSGAFRLREIA
jgi:hypothetical protein